MNWQPLTDKRLGGSFFTTYKEWWRVDECILIAILHYGCAVGVVSFIDYDSKEAWSAKLIKKYFMKCQTGGRQCLIYTIRLEHGRNLYSRAKFMGQYVWIIERYTVIGFTHLRGGVTRRERKGGPGAPSKILIELMVLTTNLACLRVNQHYVTLSFITTREVHGLYPTIIVWHLICSA